MTRLATLLLTAVLLAPPAVAQEPEDESRSLMERGAELFLRGLLDELDPALRELEDLAQEMEPALRSFGEEMGPALRDLMGQVKDWSNYHPPEMLPNGDIIIRRKQTEEAPLPRPLPGLPRPPAGTEIEL
ncbi:hypothetical protein M4578_22900 [Salipiger sp. P9]|uniref:hypothetical protein n=1 Tax=Salipiger pentaromativorans TaxID=2943193 RepID=UPI002157CBF3|nr:hypothetical protein [Salipiger pentaromativorans]MCR8550683.1 hypothetical protein [Salipiger pentaromativorans]